MRYAIVNLGQAAPVRFVPVLTDCSNVEEFRQAVKNAAERIGFHHARMQAAIAEGNQGAVDAAGDEVAQANRDWETWSAAAKKCEAAPGITPASSSGPNVVLLGLGALAIGVGAFWVASKTGLPEKLSSVFKTG